MDYSVYTDKNEAAKLFASDVCELIKSTNKQKITIAISGGSTPFVLFDIWATHYKTKIDWQRIHFFWVDERCVQPSSSESNYGNTNKVLFEKIKIPIENIHRIQGENSPEDEALRYSDEILKHVAIVNGIPQFDIILLGMGDDGHTASIFPPQIELMNSDQLISVAQNPYSKQNRLTLTGAVINNAVHIFFLVTGSAKAKIVKQIFNASTGYLEYPAAHIKAKTGNLKWILDKEAAAFLE